MEERRNGGEGRVTREVIKKGKERNGRVVNMGVFFKNGTATPIDRKKCPHIDKYDHIWSQSNDL